MKGVVVACIIVLFLAGCDRNPVEEFGKEMLVSYDKSTAAADQASLQAIQRYIRSYRALNGRYPANIDELQAAVGPDLDLEPYDYDPETGVLTARE